MSSPAVAPDRVRWIDTIPYWSVHVLAIAGVVWLGWSWTGVGICMASYAVGMFLIGGVHALVWGYFVSTVVLWHMTFTINSLAHVWGSRRYATDDTSRNNPLLGLLCLGEGWHNNHHHYQRAARQGFYWWEID